MQLVSGPAPHATLDGKNTIIFRSESWCPLEATGRCSTARFYDPAAPALTTVYTSTTTGEIREADMEINAFHFTWTDRVAHQDLTGRPLNIQNAMTQQIGHLLGFAWACVANPTNQTVRPTDHTGQPAVDCASAPDSLRSATLYPVDSANDIERRTLAADDPAALCATYPAAATVCPPDGGQACTCPAPPTGADGGQDAAGTLDAAVADAGDAPDSGGASVDDGCSCAAGHPNFLTIRHGIGTGGSRARRHHAASSRRTPMRTAFVGACLALASAGVVASAALHGCSSTGSGEPVPLMGHWEMVQTVDGAVAGVTTMVFEGSGALRLEVAATSSGLRNGGQWSANSGNLTLTSSVRDARCRWHGDRRDLPGAQRGGDLRNFERHADADDSGPRDRSERHDGAPTQMTHAAPASPVRG